MNCLPHTLFFGFYSVLGQSLTNFVRYGLKLEILLSLPPEWLGFRGMPHHFWLLKVICNNNSSTWLLTLRIPHCSLRNSSAFSPHLFLQIYVVLTLDLCYVNLWPISRKMLRRNTHNIFKSRCFNSWIWFSIGIYLNWKFLNSP